MFHPRSFSEKGTLYQLKNLLNHRRVTFNKSKIQDFDACDDFLKLTVSAFIVTAAMELLNMTNMDDAPTSPLLPEDNWLEDQDVRHDTLNAVSSMIVKTHVHLDFREDSTHTATTTCTTDKKLEYSNLLLSVGLLYLEFCDGIKEGDGTRV